MSKDSIIKKWIKLDINIIFTGLEIGLENTSAKKVSTNEEHIFL